MLVLAKQCLLLLEAALCVGYLLLATASCGLETPSFLTSFPLPYFFTCVLAVTFCLWVWGGVCGMCGKRKRKFTFNIQVTVLCLAFCLSFHDNVRGAPDCFKSTYMNICREYLSQPLSFYPGNASLAADVRGRSGGERDAERLYLLVIWSFKFRNSGKVWVTSLPNSGILSKRGGRTLL